MTAASHLMNASFLLLLGLVLLAAVVIGRTAARWTAVRPARRPLTFNPRQDPGQPNLNHKPVVPEASESKGPGSGAISDHGWHILFVEDDRSFAESGRIMLKQLGYRVTLVADANEALAVIRSALEKIDCVITDLSMPGMSGFDLARLCQRLLPGVPVILMSSQDSVIAVELLQACGIHGLLPKPFTRQTLARAVPHEPSGAKKLDGPLIEP